MQNFLLALKRFGFDETNGGLLIYALDSIFRRLDIGKYRISFYAYGMNNSDYTKYIVSDKQYLDKDLQSLGVCEIALARAAYMGWIYAYTRDFSIRPNTMKQDKALRMVKKLIPYMSIREDRQRSAEFDVVFMVLTRVMSDTMVNTEVLNGVNEELCSTAGYDGFKGIRKLPEIKDPSYIRVTQPTSSVQGKLTTGGGVKPKAKKNKSNKEVSKRLFTTCARMLTKETNLVITMFVGIIKHPTPT